MILMLFAIVIASPSAAYFVSAVIENVKLHKTRVAVLMSAGLRGNGVIAVLREAKSKWERRAPITPEHVATLVKSGVRVLVQPCELILMLGASELTLAIGTHRVFTDSQYIAAGAAVQEDVSPASVLLGVKEVPVDLLISNRT
jgi:hypothetical protein